MTSGASSNLAGSMRLVLSTKSLADLMSTQNPDTTANLGREPMRLADYLADLSPVRPRNSMADFIFTQYIEISI
jgi:hypothetical protein